MNEKKKKIIKILGLLILLVVLCWICLPFVYHTSSHRSTTYDSPQEQISEFVFGETKNSAPFARISADITSGKKPLKIDFRGSGTDSDGKIVSYNWDFGDGSTSDGKNPSHTFEEEGIYTVGLIVTDNGGKTDKDTLTINVIRNQPPRAHATYYSYRYYWNQTSPVVAYFQGEGEDSDGEIVFYHWEFGPKYHPITPYWGYFFNRNDDRPPFYTYDYTADEQNPIRVFYGSGYYWARLTVTDNDGATDTDTVNIYVYNVRTTIKKTIKEMFQN